LQGGTRPLDLVGSGVASFIQRRTTDAAHHHKIMQTLETVTITNNGATISMTGDYTQIANFLIGLSQATVQSAPITNNEPTELAPFHAFLTVELTPYFGSAGATFIVSKLKLGRDCNDFRYLIPAYRLVKGDIEKRQLLKTISAVYRYKFGGHKNPEKYSLRSEIKYAKACDHCGKLAQTLVNRLIAEGLWVA
jgi:hypothetical protein